MFICKSTESSIIRYSFQKTGIDMIDRHDRQDPQCQRRQKEEGIRAREGAA